MDMADARHFRSQKFFLVIHGLHHMIIYAPPTWALNCCLESQAWLFSDSLLTLSKGRHRSHVFFELLVEAGRAGRRRGAAGRGGGRGGRGGAGGRRAARRGWATRGAEAARRAPGWRRRERARAGGGRQ
ncbi:hypothetical protein BRADI_2g35492v3 [Brachypodium distachyon]|uniref:Uncharacterized protein n=1 Tax=Brachypodium distachyon TaxID=15368 RepID=A0A2K2DBZ2_BRADI|nr:hypothetical protein BRADI_2g35492v3 [Brachypodium distachyon]